MSSQKNQVSLRGVSIPIQENYLRNMKKTAPTMQRPAQTKFQLNFSLRKKREKGTKMERVMTS